METNNKEHTTETVSLPTITLTVGKLSAITETLNYLITMAAKRFTDKQGEWRKDLQPLIERPLNPEEAAHYASAMVLEAAEELDAEAELNLREELMQKIMDRGYTTVDVSAGFGELIVAATSVMPQLIDDALFFLLVAEADAARFTTFDIDQIREDMHSEIQQLKQQDLSEVRERLLHAISEITRQLTGRADPKALAALAADAINEAKTMIGGQNP